MTPAAARLPRGAFRGLAHAHPLPVQTFALRQDQHLDLTVLYVPNAQLHHCILALSRRNPVDCFFWRFGHGSCRYTQTKGNYTREVDAARKFEEPGSEST